MAVGRGRPVVISRDVSIRRFGRFSNSDVPFGVYIDLSIPIRLQYSRTLERGGAHE